MSDKDSIAKIETVVEEIRRNHEETTPEERKRAFFEVAIEIWNEEMAGDITLANGRKVTIPKI